MINRKRLFQLEVALSHSLISPVNIGPCVSGSVAASQRYCLRCLCNRQRSVASMESSGHKYSLIALAIAIHFVLLAIVLQ